LKPGLEAALRDLGFRDDIIKTMQRATSGVEREHDVAGFAQHGGQAHPANWSSGACTTS